MVENSSSRTNIELPLLSVLSYRKSNMRTNERTRRSFRSYKENHKKKSLFQSRSRISHCKYIIVDRVFEDAIR